MRWVGLWLMTTGGLLAAGETVGGASVGPLLQIDDAYFGPISFVGQPEFAALESLYFSFDMVVGPEVHSLTMNDVGWSVDGASFHSQSIAGVLVAEVDGFDHDGNPAVVARIFQFESPDFLITTTLAEQLLESLAADGMLEVGIGLPTVSGLEAVQLSSYLALSGSAGDGVYGTTATPEPASWIVWLTIGAAGLRRRQQFSARVKSDKI